MHPCEAGSILDSSKIETTQKMSLHLCKALILLAFLGSPTWARTRDLRINSPALYRLSYRGTALDYSQFGRRSESDLQRKAQRAGRQREQVHVPELVGRLL